MNTFHFVPALRRHVWLLLLLLAMVSPALAGVEISEFMASNDTTLPTDQGLYEDWVEIHNDSGSAVDLAGWYLTDNPADLRKWQFPSTPATSTLADGGYLIVFADNSDDSVIGNELHAGFKLNAGGEFLALVEPDGETVAYQYNPEFPEQTADISYGIDAGTGLHAYFAAATPGAANGQAISDAVQFSVESRTFTASFDLALSATTPGTTIRYTTDGSVPTGSSSLYHNGSPIPISVTTQVRARSFTSGLADGPIRSETYFHLAGDAVAFSSELPLVVLDNFGAGEVPHPDSATRQSCAVMIFEPVNGVCSLTNAPQVASRAGLKRRGESTLRNTANKPNLSLETWGEVDEEDQSIEPLGMPAESDWVLYAPWTIDTALVRNPFIYEASNEVGTYAVRTRFVEVFLNYDDGGGSIRESDDYYGVYVLMEKIKRGPDRVDVAELPPDVGSGDPEISGGYMWKLDKDDPNDQNFVAAGKTLTSVYPNTMPTDQLGWLTDHLNAIDAAIPGGNYESLIDVESFADQHILNVFANNADGLRLSTFFHKDRAGVVRMGPAWDFDRSMACDHDDRASNPEVWSLATDQNFFFHSSGPLWFRALALNEADFWIAWVDRWQTMREGPLSDTSMDAWIEGYRTELADAAQRNYARWSGVLDATESWSGKVDVMKSHVLTRGQWIDEQLVDPPVFNHPGGPVTGGFQLTVTGPEAQYFTVDGSDPRASGGAPAGAPYGGPITINDNTLVKARSWNGDAFVNAPSTWPWSALREVMLVVDPAPLAITEIMYHPRPPSGVAEDGYTASDFEFVEIQNTGGSACSLVGVQFLDGVDFDFTYANASTLAAGAYGVVVRNLDAFKARYPDWASRNILGTYTGRLSNRSEELELGYAPTNMLPLVAFDYEDDWYPATDGEGFSLVLEDPQSDPAGWDTKLAWRPSSAPDGSPGQANPAGAYPQGTVVINEVLTHQDTDNPGDWIELHNTSGGTIDLEGWFLSDSRGELKKYTIPGGTQIGPYGYVVFTEHDHFGSAFALSEHGDAVYLSAGSGGALSVPAYREVQDFGGQARDVTFGRHLRSDGIADFPTMAWPTMGIGNSGPLVGPVVIDEIMYHPPTNGHEYVLIRNTSAATVPLYDPANPSNAWKVSGIDFVFPAGAELNGHDALLLVRDTISAVLFRSVYGVPGTIEIFNYQGALDNDTDTLVLKKPGAPEAGTGYVPYIVVEQVKYNDSAPWPETADGLGKALGRVSASAYANDSANWQAVDSAYAPTLATLVVLSGSGDGAYTGGTEVPIQADAAPPGEVFVEWIGNVAGVDDIHASSTTLTMPGQDTTITALYGPTSSVVLFAEDAVWKYDDLGHDLGGTTWRDKDHDDSAWASGPAQLGYGDGDVVTTVSFGGNSSDKHPTTYFRHTFVVEEGTSLVALTLDVLRDDGVIMYINGQEAMRDNLPDAPAAIEYSTLASATVNGDNENTFFTFALDPSVVVPGTNAVAVEIHQRALNSSDLMFAARLEGTRATEPVKVDGDADGMVDAYEIEQFGSTEAGIPDVDSDGDGVWNVDESVAGTQATNGASFFRIDAIDSGSISWTPVSGRVYSVQWAGDLVQPFVEIADGLTSGSYTDPRNPTNTANCYRIEVELE